MVNKEIICFLLRKNNSIQEYKKELASLSQADWEYLLITCARYGLRPLIYFNLRLLFDEDCIPVFVQDDLREAHLESAYKNMLIFRHAGILLSALESEDVPVIGLKGIFLLENIYNNIAARALGDIDIMVKKEDLQVAINILINLGYTMETYFSPIDQNTDIKHVSPMKNADGLSVEIHWTILNEEEPFAIDPDGLWDRAVPVNIAGVDVLALSPEDLVLHLCLHFAYQHHLNLGLRGLNDVTEVLQHYNKQLDWARLDVLSQKWGVGRVVWLALSLTVKLLGAPVPQDVLNRLEPEKVESWVLPNARSIVLNAREKAALMTPDLADFASEKGFLNRIKLIMSRIFLPKLILARLYGVPPSSVLIYGCYFRRLKELIQQYGFSIRNILKNESDVVSSVEDQQGIAKLRTWMLKG